MSSRVIAEFGDGFVRLDVLEMHERNTAKMFFAEIYIFLINFMAVLASRSPVFGAIWLGGPSVVS